MAVVAGVCADGRRKSDHLNSNESPPPKKNLTRDGVKERSERSNVLRRIGKTPELTTVQVTA